MQAEKDITLTELKGQHGNIGEIFLNRPKALNALTRDMCIAIRTQLNEWENNSTIKAVIIKGAGDRAFCAGGDIRKMYELKKTDETEKASFFFKDEYSMNTKIFHFNKPYISFLNGLTMGGGAGVSIHGSHRIATEKFVFAMPESGIGFFTDIGASYFLTRCPHYLGWYLALTGNKINAADALSLGLITHFMDSHQLDKLEQQLLDTKFENDPFISVSNIIKKFHQNNQNIELTQYKKQIASIFSADSVETIIGQLENSKETFLQEAAKTMKKRSPTSLKVIFEQFHRAKKMEFDTIMEMEYIIALNFLKSHDFFEGIRAALIDKDQNPHWKPDKLSDITNKYIDSFFNSA